MLSLFEYILPVKLILKVIIIIVIAIMTILGAVVVPKGKIIVVIAGILGILVIWYVDLEFLL